MEKENVDITDKLIDLLQANRSDLVGQYQKALRQALFNTRSKMHPNMLRQIATDEVDALTDFLQQSQWDASGRGAQLHQAGLSVPPLMRLGQVTRQFFVIHLEAEQISTALEVVDNYQNYVVQGFVESLESNVFDVQERTRHAFERVANRDNQQPA